MNNDFRVGRADLSAGEVTTWLEQFLWSGSVRSEGQWVVAGTAIDTEITLVDQERGKEFEYRDIAINKAGDGEPSNTVMAGWMSPT